MRPETATDEEGISRLVTGSGADAGAQLKSILAAIWQGEAKYSEASQKKTDISKAVAAYKR